ncbi:MAG: tripartite tricarboxylate transporter permease, partial [Chloroflexota bacterium]
TLVLAVFEALLLSVVLLWVVGSLITSVWANVIGGVSPRLLGTTVMLLALVGAYASTSALFGISVALIAGGASYILRAAGFSIPAIVIAFVIGPGFENSFRTALTYSHGSFAVFIQNPASAIIIALALGSLTFSVASGYHAARRKRAAAVGPAEGTSANLTAGEP